MSDEQTFGDEIIDDQNVEGKPPVDDKGGAGKLDLAGDEMKKALADLAGKVGSIADAQKPKEKELTPDEINQLWAIYDPKKTKPDFMRKFFRLNPDATPEEEKEASDLFYEMRDGMVKQAVVGARHYMKSELDKIMKQVQPLEEYVSASRAKEMKSRFDTKYETLADPQFAKVVDAAARRLADKEFANEDEYFKALAEDAADMIKTVKPDFDLGAKVEKKKTTTTTPRLPRSSAGGTGGAGAGAGAGKSNGSSEGDDAGSINW